MILLMLIMCLSFVAVTFAGGLSLPEASVISNSYNVSATDSGVIIWLEKYWPFVALIVSEALAFIPGPLNGILQAIVKLGNAIFKRP